jgi:RNA polymerase sigma-70 factor (ECF subfamily)
MRAALRARGKGHSEVLAASGTPPGVAALLEAASGGDERAWRSIIDLYGRRVYALAKSRCGRHDLAEEITQSVFVTVAAKLGGRDAGGSGEYLEMGRFESWLFRVAMNRIRDEMRRLKRHAEPTDPAALRCAGAAAPPDAGAADDLARLRDAITRLSDADREVVELRHHAGLSFRQMADMLDEPIGTLLARHHRALRKLKTLLTGAASAALE